MLWILHWIESFLSFVVLIEQTIGNNEFLLEQKVSLTNNNAIKISALLKKLENLKQSTSSVPKKSQVLLVYDENDLILSN